MPLPRLIVISGPAGSGTTLLAHEVAKVIPCPAVCRDELAERMAAASEPGEDLTPRTLSAFFSTVGLLVDRGMTAVAEASFQHNLWIRHLRSLRERADIRVVQCHTSIAAARGRVAARRGSRSGLRDVALLAEGDTYWETFHRLSIDVPSIDVDTTAGYRPSLDEVIAFVRPPVV